MLASLIIVFREVLEAGIITGIVLAATRGIKGRNIFVAAGIIAGVAGACLVALGASAISDAFAGDGQDIFNAVVLCIAVLMLGWHNIWMASHGRELARDAGAFSRGVAEGHKPLYALAVVIGVAVLREGSEVVLFLYGVAISGHESLRDIMGGSVLGLLAGVLVTCLIYFGLVQIPMRHLFRVTGILIAFLASGLASQAEVFLAQGDVITIGQRQLWNTSSLLKEDSLVGRALHILFGYSDRPTASQLLVYLIILAIILGLGKVVASGSPLRVKQATST